MELKKILLTFLLLTLSISIVNAQELNDFEYLKLQIDNTINFKIQKDQNYNVNFLNVNSFIFPQNQEGSQYLNEIDSTHTYSAINSGDNIYLNFKFNNDNLQTNNEIINTFVIESQANRPQVKNKVRYPLNFVGSSYQEYLEYTDFINVDDNIKSKANELASGESDTYIVASKVAKWIIENVKYDLTTLSENPNQDSIEVFESKTGVCREITNLYVSMMRSLGIPARVVTGYSYTNSEELIDLLNSNWGGHAWAEVLIGSTWVPFDLTYNQYGYVDSTHIVFDKYKSIRPSTLSINGSGYGFNLIESSLSSDVTINVLEQKDEELDHGFDIEITGPDELGFGSYGYIKLDIENTKNYYQVFFVSIAKTEEVELIDFDKKMMIFKPKEEKTLYVRYKLPTLETGFQYTFPFTLYNEFFQENFEVNMREEYLSIKEVSLPQNSDEEMKFTSYNIKSNCDFNFLENKIYEIECFFKNTNNYEIADLEVCLKDNCEKSSLKINEEKLFTFITNESYEVIKYNYENKTFEVPIIILNPKVDFNHKELEDTIEVNYYILNYKNNLTLYIYFNEELYKREAQKSNKIIFSPKTKETKIELELMYNGVLLDKQELTVFTQVNNSISTIEGSNEKEKDPSFLKWIIDSILSIFKSQEN